MKEIKSHGGRRDNAGRKPVPVEQKKKQRSISLADSEYESLRKIAKSEKISIGALIVKWLEEKNKK